MIKLNYFFLFFIWTIKTTGYHHLILSFLFSRKKSSTCTVCTVRIRLGQRRSEIRSATRTPSFWWVQSSHLIPHRNLSSPHRQLISHHRQLICILVYFVEFMYFWSKLYWFHILLKQSRLVNDCIVISKDSVYFVNSRNAREGLVTNFHWGLISWNLYKGSPSTSCY